MHLMCKDVHCSIAHKEILRGISLHADGHKFYTILGPNGCGKTTLLKNIYRIIKPDSGAVYLDGKDIRAVRLKDSAKEMAVVAQFNTLNFNCSVQDIVMLGRTPHIRFMQTEREEDFTIIQDALAKVGMLTRKDQPYQSLSGGEKQRVVLARAIAQQPSLLLLDEPTNHLDIKYQLEILQIVKDLRINVLAVLHDIQLACRYSDYLYLMKDGDILYEGSPRTTITEESMLTIYGVRCNISWTEDSQAMIHYRGPL